MGKQTPNHQDEIYLEIPRSQLLMRGFMSFLSPFMGASTLYALSLIFESFKLGVPWLAVSSVGIFLLGIWATAGSFRVDTSPPRDEPIRFNRARQKIYAYNFRHQWWNPFGRWYVETVSYNWSQVRAERWSQQAGSVFKSGVMLSIVELGTNNVIDRFPLTFLGTDRHAWAYVCTYMQEGPSALPPPGPPKDHNDVLWCEFALRLAPKVVWPPEMDQESRSAP
jgi:hypothetical protein